MGDDLTKNATILILLFLLLYPSCIFSQEQKQDASADTEKEEKLQTTSEAKPDEAGKKESRETTEPATQELSPSITGSAAVRYRLKTTDGETDQDFYGDLRFQIQDIVPEKISFSFYGRSYWDIGGEQGQSSRQTDFFRDIYDSYETRVQGRLYHAYFTLTNIIPDTLFYVGRQSHYIDQSYDFDGGYGEISLGKQIKISAFGGSSVYSFKGPRGGDWVVGAGAELYPLEGTKFNVDYVYLAEDAKNEGLDDYQVIFRLRQQLWQNWYLLGQMVVLNDEAKDLSLSSTCYLPDYDLQIRFSFYALFNDLENLTSTLSRYFGSYKPYQQYEFNISKGLGDNFSIAAGYTARVLDKSRDKGTFNREFHRFYATGSVQDLPAKGLEASVTVQGWVTDGVGDNDLVGVDAEIGYRFNENLKATVGMGYDLYQYEYNYQQLNERVGLTTVYAKAKYKATKMWSFLGEFSWEYDEEREFFLMELGVEAKF
jgi:hypothetical protein